MPQDHIKKEALFNEVKGSLFEYLVAKKIAKGQQDELSFIQSLDKNYLSVLSQQDRMVREFYPEMVDFLDTVSYQTSLSIIHYFKTHPHSPKLMGKLINSGSQLHHESDLSVIADDKFIPISLKLNKKNAFVNTKSGGIKSFFSHYFSFINKTIQENFNHFVDQEFSRMAFELHALNDWEYPGHFGQWIKAGKSELPGELGPSERLVLKDYYCRIAHQMHLILTEAQVLDPLAFSNSLAPLIGFSSIEILQVVCLHEFPSLESLVVNIHPFEEIEGLLKDPKIKSFGKVSSVEISLGHWTLQIRVKPMNKFTTTAIKINCSVKVKPR